MQLGEKPPPKAVNCPIGLFGVVKVGNFQSFYTLLLQSYFCYFAGKTLRPIAVQSHQTPDSAQ
jgi:hypothetical protein